MHPRAREDNLIVEPVGDELLVYDRDRHQAHCLSRATAFIWRRCDGEHSAKELTRILGAELEIHVAERIVWRTLEALDRVGLFRERLPVPREIADRSQLTAVSVDVSAPALPSDECGMDSITAPTPMPQALPLPEDSRS